MRWDNFEVLFTGEGTEDDPIRLRAETPGEVFLTGQSNLRLAGEWLDVSGLIFTDGFTPTREVISFRRNKDHLANNSRVHNVVIDDYNPTERTSSDFWVMIYGKNNRFDHNSLINKRNRGVTMAVRMNTEESRENNHRIDHNYFGPRPILGSNGGETLRIGTSHYSRSDSFTRVENNYFDRADGEVEIVSSKSGGNVFRNNTFYKSRGTLTLRHGNGNLIERNAINRYDPVISAVITNNSLIDSDNIQLGAGSDAERSAVPTDTKMEKNLVIHRQGRNSMTVYDDMSGISFNGNVSNVELKPLADSFDVRDVKLKRGKNGLLYPVGNMDVGALLAGTHIVDRVITIPHTLKFEGVGNPTLLYERDALFQIQEGGSLRIEGLTISGADTPDSAGNVVIRTSPYSMLKNYRLEIADTVFEDLDVNHSFDVISAAKGTRGG